MDAKTRQSLFCAWEPVNVRLGDTPWAECGVEYRPATDDAPAFPSTCAVFTTNLPEVIEAARAHLHWSKGELSHFTRGPATEALVFGIEAMANATGETISWIAENPRKKAGA